ncbi:MAG: hypothetical protein AB7D35_05305 [Bacteroidales bacterium]
MRKISTVRGDISPEKLGLTSMHDHTLNDMRGLVDVFKQFFPPVPDEMLEFKMENFSFLKTGMVMLSEDHAVTDDIDYMIKEFNAFKRVGGKSIVDASMIGMRGNLKDIQKISEQTEINVICATGFFNGLALPQEIEEQFNKGEKGQMAILEQEINEGIEGTGIKPGFIKCALDTPNENGQLNEKELQILRSCANVAAEKGMCLEVHTASKLTPELILVAIDMVLEETEISPDKLVVLHMDQFMTRFDILLDYISDLSATKELSIDFYEKLLDKGVNISFDTWGSPITSTYYYYPEDFDRIKVVIALLKKGYASQIVFGHDVVGKMYGVSYGNYGYTRFPEFIPAMLSQVGLEDKVNTMFVENPARILAY